MRNTELLDQRDAKIRTRMAELEKKYPKWRTECLIEELHKEFFLATRTIENILSNRSRSKPRKVCGVDPRQMALFWFTIYGFTIYPPLTPPRRGISRAGGDNKIIKPGHGWCPGFFYTLIFRVGFGVVDFGFCFARVMCVVKDNCISRISSDRSISLKSV